MVIPSFINNILDALKEAGKDQLYKLKDMVDITAPIAGFLPPQARLIHAGLSAATALGTAAIEGKNMKEAALEAGLNMAGSLIPGGGGKILGTIAKSAIKGAVKGAIKGAIKGAAKRALKGIMI